MTKTNTLPQGSTRPQNNLSPHGTILSAGDFTYRVDCHWGELDHNKTPVENCHALAFDSNNQIIMVTDHPNNNVIIYNQDGKLIDAWGTMFPGAHSVKVVNENGEDFLYIVDSGWISNRRWDGISTDDWESPYNKVVSQAGFIAKTTLDGKLLFTISHPQTIGIYNKGMPFNPTDIAIAANGDLYVADGYGSDHIIQYNSLGQYIRHFGGQNNQNKMHNIHNAHGIEIDNRQAGKPKLVISSRAEQALKYFTLEGEYINTIQVSGAWIHAPFFQGDYGYAPVCWSQINEAPANNSGFISIFDKHNKIVANLGATQPEYLNNVLQPIQTTWNVFNHCHGLCVDQHSNIYLGQWRANQSYPWKLTRI